MPVYAITCPNCAEVFEVEVGFDYGHMVSFISEAIEKSDSRRGGMPCFRTYEELRSLCGDTSESLGANEFNKCVRYCVERGFLERRKIGHSWKFRKRKRHEYPASPSRQRRRRTGLDWGHEPKKPSGPNRGIQ